MSTEKRNAVFYRSTNFSQVTDDITVEAALSISINETLFTITMQTPGNEKDLVRGLLYSEGIFRNLSHDPDIEVRSKNLKGYVSSVNVRIPEEMVLKDFSGSRNVMSASSCGMCGKISLDEPGSTSVSNTELLEPSIVPRMFEIVNEKQKVFRKTGGTHAAGAFTIDGELLVVQEDIGRHNAVDKVIGFLIHHQLLDKAQCLTLSGRVSYEIVSKARSANIPFLAAVSAPSSLAIDTAQESGITLMAFCRDNHFTVYSNPQKIVGDADHSVTRKVV